MASILFEWFGQVPWPTVAAVSAGLLGTFAVYVFGRRRARARLAAAGAASAEATVPDPFETGSLGERRRGLRRKGGAVGVNIVSDVNPGQMVPGLVLDRSTGGLGLLVEKEVESGTILKVKALNAPQTTPWVEVEVKTCKPDGHEWQLGCSFLKTPPWSILLLFG